MKARLFVVTLRDYYLDMSTSDTQGTSASATGSSLNPDEWAIKFIDVTWLQPISEAFDDDTSGFINIAEVNRFTSSRPADWRFVPRYSNRYCLMRFSLPHWLAFWAVGEYYILFLTYAVLNPSKALGHLSLTTLKRFMICLPRWKVSARRCFHLTERSLTTISLAHGGKFVH